MNTQRVRGQSALEFTVLSGAMLLGILLIVVASGSILRDAQEDQQQAALRAIEDAILRELTQALLSVDGYERTFELPATLDGSAYAVTLLEETPPARDVIIMTWRETTRVTFSQAELSGSLGPGKNTLRRAGGNLTVENG